MHVLLVTEGVKFLIALNTISTPSLNISTTRMCYRSRQHDYSGCAWCAYIRYHTVSDHHNLDTHSMSHHPTMSTKASTSIAEADMLDSEDSSSVHSFWSEHALRGPSPHYVSTSLIVTSNITLADVHTEEATPHMVV